MRNLPSLQRHIHLHLPPLFFPHSAIISDITTPANRGKALAHVGIAFAICFIIGPPIGAYFASRPVPAGLTAGGMELNVYAAPALLTLVLLSAETLFLMVALPETRGKAIKQDETTTESSGKTTNATDGPNNNSVPVAPKQSISQRLKMLKTLQSLHFYFLGLFSGVEFTLTFLTFDRAYLKPAFSFSKC